MSDKSIAVVLGTYNRLSLLKRSIASVRRFGQPTGLPPVHFFVVDGGSSDGTREWLREQLDVSLIEQEGELTGAVRAFNLGFGEAVRRGYPYIMNFNDDVEFIIDVQMDRVIERLAQDEVGAVAFMFDTIGKNDYRIFGHHGRYIINYGVTKREAGMAVARAQGDLTGERWWNPIYRTYAADSEFGCWLWKLGYRVVGALWTRVRDEQPLDDLRILNQSFGPVGFEHNTFDSRWPHASQLEPMNTNLGSAVALGTSKVHLGCGGKHLDGWVNADVLLTPAVDVVCDMLDGLRTVTSGSVSMIYWCHGPEHIYVDKLGQVWAELRRVLRSGGALLVATIDLEGIYENRFKKALNGSNWNAALYGQTGSADHPGLSHKQCFTYDMLAGQLRHAGFGEISKWEPEQYPEILALNDFATSCRLVTVHVRAVP